MKRLIIGLLISTYAIFNLSSYAGIDEEKCNAEYLLKRTVFDKNVEFFSVQESCKGALETLKDLSRATWKDPNTKIGVATLVVCRKKGLSEKECDKYNNLSLASVAEILKEQMKGKKS